MTDFDKIIEAMTSAFYAADPMNNGPEECMKAAFQAIEDAGFVVIKPTKPPHK